MKRVYKDYDNIPTPLESQNCLGFIADSLVELGGHNFQGGYYASADVKDRLSRMYNSKCAFCELDTSAGASLQVEHYRPKAKVTGDNAHPGYYWLGYEWSNLLYACAKCNRSKSNHFPILENRCSAPPLTPQGTLDRERCSIMDNDYTSESALIINPELMDPRPHIGFLPSGKIRGRTPEGINTIKFCKLYRNPLVIARKKMISQTLFELKKVVSEFRNGNTPETTVEYVIKNEVAKLLLTINQNESFSELARTALLNFEYFFIRRFGRQVDQVLVRRYFELIRLNGLNPD